MKTKMSSNTANPKMWMRQCTRLSFLDILNSKFLLCFFLMLGSFKIIYILCSKKYTLFIIITTRFFIILLYKQFFLLGIPSLTLVYSYPSKDLLKILKEGGVYGNKAPVVNSKIYYK